MQSVTVTINDINDEIPGCSNRLYYFNVDEELSNSCKLSKTSTAVFLCLRSNTQKRSCKLCTGQNVQNFPLSKNYRKKTMGKCPMHKTFICLDKSFFSFCWFRTPQHSGKMVANIALCLADVGTVSCADTEAGNFGTLRYSLQSGDEYPETFRIRNSNNNGHLKTQRNADYDSSSRPDRYELLIKVVDNPGASPRHSATVTAVVVVGIINMGASRLFPHLPLSAQTAQDIFETGHLDSVVKKKRL